MLLIVASMGAMILRDGLILAFQAQSTWHIRGIFQQQIPVGDLLVGSVNLGLGNNALNVMQTALPKDTHQSIWLTTRNLIIHIPLKQELGGSLKHGGIQTT